MRRFGSSASGSCGIDANLTKPASAKSCANDLAETTVLPRRIRIRPVSETLSPCLSWNGTMIPGGCSLACWRPFRLRRYRDADSNQPFRHFTDFDTGYLEPCFHIDDGNIVAVGVAHADVVSIRRERNPVRPFTSDYTPCDLLRLDV